MPTLKEYQQIALAFREILEVYSKGATSNVVFSDFPRGACGGVADLLGYYLEKVFDLDCGICMRFFTKWGFTCLEFS